MNRRTHGFSLLELVVVLAIFALVALMGVQVIRASVGADRRLTEISETSGELALALALLRRDLAAGIGLPFYPESGGAESALRVGQGGFALSVSGLGGAEQGGSGLGRVVWRLDAGDGRLTRQVWTTLSPGGARAAGPQVVMLDGVDEITVESFSLQSGWRQGFAADPRDPNALPRGLRVRLDHRRFAQLETLVSLR